MIELLQRFLVERGMAPHGYCLWWDPTLIWAHAVSDALIGISYFSIPIVIATFLTQRRDIQFSWVVWMFAIFIMACGTTHFMSILTLWVPAYGVEALIKMVTAAASVATAIALWPLLPKAIAVPSPAQLQRVNEQLSSRIAERDAALLALERANQEREHTAEMLRQAQKMEAVGQLTGGLAHDFNNLLTVVIANLERVQRAGGGDERVAKSLENAMAGATRCATLTDQLLAFARRQPLQPARHDLNRIVSGMQTMLQSSLDGAISVVYALSEDLPDVEIDKVQTENAILNMALNARDAMPQGGELAISTACHDDQVWLEVRDTGIGMPAETLDKIFEPFFTTKALGAGTGLGLSQVYGFVKQSAGDISVTSIVGEGTAVLIKLPAAVRKATA